MSDSENSERTIADGIIQLSMKRPHVVLLGAGASRAALPSGDRNGQRLPLMDDFLEIVPLADLLQSAGIPTATPNFEDVYSRISVDQTKHKLRDELERRVFDYFDSLDLPHTPTLYDHLIVSLRSKDVIATFNWDPFLVQAARRHSYIGEMPNLLFLHGNVLHGYCEKDGVSGARGTACSQCGGQFAPDRLLFPIAEKNYESDPSIRMAWKALRHAFKHAFMVTIFGYGAPESDKSAVSLLKVAWGSAEQRTMEQFEIIDIRPESALKQRWEPFIHTHHYAVHGDFYDSWIAKHPRRTGEAYTNQYLNASFIEDNAIPREASLEELRQWLRPLLDMERRARG